MWRTEEGSTGRLIQLCAGYFAFYVLTGVAAKYYGGSPAQGLPGMGGMAYLVYNTLGGTLLCLGVVVAAGWYRLPTRDLLYVIPSGICTAVVIPTTTLMYTLPISVMVAMVIMRGSIIIVSRVVDAIQIRQGILHKQVHALENVAVIFALLAVSVHLVLGHDPAGPSFDFLGSPAAVAILSSYIAAYFIRIYLMNYYKNTRPSGARGSNQAFFGVEQLAATTAMVLAGLIAWRLGRGSQLPQLQEFAAALDAPHPNAWGAGIAGLAYGMVAFFSVFIFMYKGRTATFAGLVNRLTSLTAGTASTLIFFGLYGGPAPEPRDWVSLGFILVAVAFLARAERARAPVAA